jgi:hypothetical protein
MQAMQDRDLLEDVDVVVAMAVDSLACPLRMCPADFLLPMVVESHQHHLPMVAAFLPVEEVTVDINEALPSLPGISPQVYSMVDSHKTQHSIIPLPMQCTCSSTAVFKFGKAVSKLECLIFLRV